MVYRGKEPFFKPMPTDRLFTATAGIVPMDRRLCPMGNWAELRKPSRQFCEAANDIPNVPRVSLPTKGEHENKLHAAFQRFNDRDRPTSLQASSSGATPISFSASSHTNLGAATPMTPTTPKPITEDPFTPLDLNPGAQFVHYDSVQQAWLKHPAGLASVIFPPHTIGCVEINASHVLN